MTGCGKHTVASLTSSSAVLLAFLPKCPACIFFVLAPLGIPFDGARSLLIYTSLLLLAAPLIFLWRSACGRCSARPLYLAVAGSTATAIGRFGVSGTALPVAGALMVAVA